MIARGGHNQRRVCSWKPRTVMSSIMRAHNGLTGRSEVSEVIGALSRAEGCWTFDARDRMPRQSRATAHRPRHALPPASGFVHRLFLVIGVMDPFLLQPLSAQSHGITARWAVWIRL